MDFGPVMAITDLSPEVITLIMDFLPLEDTISASQTCKMWYYEVSQLWNKLADRIVYVSKTRVIQDLCPTEDKHCPGTFEWRPSPCLRKFHFFSYVDRMKVESVGLMRYFWQCYGPQIQELSFTDCKISDKAFGDILSQCPSLASLSIVAWDNSSDTEEALFKSGTVLESRENLRLEHLMELKVIYRSRLSDRIFNRLVSMAPNLSTLSVCCPEIITSSSDQQDEVDNLQWSSKSSSERQIPLNAAANKFTLENFCRVLSILRVKILTIELEDELFHSSYNVKEQIFEVLGEKLKGRLQNLALRLDPTLSNKPIERIANAFENSLQELDISLCQYEMSNDDMLHLGRLTKLQTLIMDDITEEPYLESATILELRKLTKLQHFEISFITDEHVPALCQALSGMKELKHLRIGNASLEQGINLFELVKILPQLETLKFPDLDIDDGPLIDFIVAAIIYTQHRTLKILELANISCMKGYGLTGVINELLGEEEADITKAKESLDSIKNMPKFKDLMEKGVKNYLELGKSTALTRLNLSRCDALTDEGLENVFKLHQQLQFLSLGEGPLITDSTLKLIGTYCLQLKFLFLNGCPITDVGIGYLSNLRRLRTIDLGNCSLLTDASLETLMMAKLPLRKAYYEDTKFSVNAIQKFEEWLER